MFYENKRVATALILIYVLCATTLAAIIKKISLAAPIVQTLAIVYSTATILFIPVLCKCGIKKIIITESKIMQFLKAFFGSAQFFLMLLAVAKLPLANALLLRGAAPLWVLLFSGIILRDEKSKMTWQILIIGFLGVAILLHPSSHCFNVGYVYAILSGITLGMNSVVTRVLHRKSNDSLQTMFYSLLLPSIVLLSFSMMNWHSISLHVLLFQIAAGFMLFFTILTFINSYKYATALFLAPFSYSIFLLAIFYDYLLWNHVPSALTIIGGIIIVISCFLNIKFNQKGA